MGPALRRCFIPVMSGFIAACAPPAPEGAAGPDPLRRFALPAPAGEIAFVSDTQSPIWIETLVLREDRNRTATARIFSELHRIRPSAAFILGDVVNLGFRDQEWEHMDSLFAPLRTDGVPLYALLGNHDVMLLPGAGEERFQRRFPDHRRTGYVRTVDSVAVVMLNSNFWTMDHDARALQDAWLGTVLDSLDADPAVAAVVVTCHHSPFSNSRIVGYSLESQRRFVPPFLASSKGRLFMSGHAHTFEHFRNEGKDFLVIGGGGGLQHPLFRGRFQPFPDLSPGDRKPRFHYTTIRRTGGTLRVTIHRLEETFASFSIHYRFEIPVRTSRVTTADSRRQADP